MYEIICQKSPVRLGRYVREMTVRLGSNELPTETFIQKSGNFLYKPFT